MRRYSLTALCLSATWFINDASIAYDIYLSVADARLLAAPHAALREAESLREIDTPLTDDAFAAMSEAIQLNQAKKYAEARDRGRKIVKAMMLRRDEVPDVIIAEYYSLQGGFEFDMRDYRTAAQLYVAALSHLRRNGEVPNDQVARLVYNLASAMEQEGHADMARRMFERLLKEPNSDMDVEETVALHASRARAILASNDRALAGRAIRGAEELIAQVGDKPLSVPTYWLVKSQLQLSKGKRAQAKKSLSIAVRQLEQAFGASDVRFVDAAIRLAELHHENLDLTAASDLLGRIQIDDSNFGDNHPSVVKLRGLRSRIRSSSSDSK